MQARHLEKECLVSGAHWTDVSWEIKAYVHYAPETGARWAGERTRGGRVCLPLDWTESWLCCFPDSSDGKESAYNIGDLGSIPGLWRSPGEGNGNPLQYSCLENPMDRGAGQATVHGVTESQTQLNDLAHTQGMGYSSEPPPPLQEFQARSRY